MPTMKDVARLAGVSVQTVSCVVNEKPGISPETQARVWQAINALGYRPYSIARSLRTRHTRTIALFVTDINNPSLAAMASAAEDCAHAFDYSLVLYNTHGDIEREANYIRTAIERWVDGVVVIAVSEQMPSLKKLDEVGIPMVAIDRIPAQHTGPTVTIDNFKAGCLAAEHLLDLGHTRVAHISGPLSLHLARERLAGFQQAFEARGLTAGLCATGEGHWECAEGYQAMQRILAGNGCPTAIFAANDRMAFGAMRAIAEAGLRVPHDISVVGLDDIEVSAFQTPPLTTVRQSFTQMARLGVELLLNLLAGTQPEQPHVVLEPTLVVRQSTAPPRG